MTEPQVATDYQDSAFAAELDRRPAGDEPTLLSEDDPNVDDQDEMATTTDREDDPGDAMVDRRRRFEAEVWFNNPEAAKAGEKALAAAGYVFDEDDEVSLSLAPTVYGVISGRVAAGVDEDVIFRRLTEITEPYGLCDRFETDEVILHKVFERVPRSS
jgi:hypothetical protein